MFIQSIFYMYLFIAFTFFSGDGDGNGAGDLHVLPNISYVQYTCNLRLLAMLLYLFMLSKIS